MWVTFVCFSLQCILPYYFLTACLQSLSDGFTFTTNKGTAAKNWRRTCCAVNVYWYDWCKIYNIFLNKMLIILYKLCMNSLWLTLGNYFRVWKICLNGENDFRGRKTTSIVWNSCSAKLWRKSVRYAYCISIIFRQLIFEFYLFW